MPDIDLVLMAGFLACASVGMACALFATYRYFRFEKHLSDSYVPVALISFGIFYASLFPLVLVLRYRLLPTLVLFAMVMALLTSIRMGLKAGSCAGRSIALAAGFTMGALACRITYDTRILSFGWR